MSVVKGKRDEGELKIVTKINELMAYTMTVCSNEKNFPKRYRWCITNRIIQTTQDITDDIIHANSVYVRDKNDLTRRLTYQREALESTYVLLNQITIAYKTFGVESHRIEVWTGMIDEIQRLLRGWHRNDKERYSNIG